MTVTNKLIKQYFLERSTMNASSTGGYYYGSSAVEQDPFNVEHESVELDQIFNPGTTNDSITSIVVQSDGKILAAITLTIGGVTRYYIGRLNYDGTLDTDFNPNPNAFVRHIAIQSDGKILITGQFTTVGGVTRNRIARLNSDGTLDTSFNPDSVSHSGGSGDVYFAAIQPDGKIIIGGYFNIVGGVTRNYIARLNSDGTLDTTFNPNANATIEDITFQSNDKILITGSFTTVGGVTRNRIARLNSDGTLDTGFNPNVNSAIRSIAIQSDSKILIGGYFTTVGGVTRNRIARLNSDGTLDTSFNPNISNYVSAIALQSDGKILIGGNFLEVDGVTRNHIARLNLDGTLDVGLNITPNQVVTAVALQSNGEIVIAGDFTTVDGVARDGIARLKEIIDNAPYKLIYTVPSGTNIVLESLFATNHNDFIVSYDIAIVPYADTNVSEKHYLKWDEIIESNGFKTTREKVCLSTGDKIYVYSSTDENISFNIFGAEVS